MKNFILSVLIVFLAFGYTAYSWDLFEPEVGNAEAICPRCETTYTLNICGNCNAESAFELIIDGTVIRCTNCDEMYATYQCRSDGANINRFNIVRSDTSNLSAL